MPPCTSWIVILLAALAGLAGGTLGMTLLALLVVHRQQRADDAWYPGGRDQ